MSTQSEDWSRAAGALKKAKWEKLHNIVSPDDTYTNTWRMPVHGGWIVRVSEMCVMGGLTNRPSITTAITFVPDPDHLWDLT